MKSFIKENTWLVGMSVGWGNGYVIIPKEHPYYGKHYDDIDVCVHGGLTFSEFAKDLDKEHWPEIKDDDDGWVVGFDTAHWGDNRNNWTKEKVKEETKNLKKQLLSIKEN